MTELMRSCKSRAFGSPAWKNPRTHVSTAKLLDLLSRGFTIESRVLGRWGYVTEVSGEVVYITDSPKPRANAKRWVTGFDSGDRVCLVKVGPTKFLLRNYKRDITGMFAGLKRGARRATKAARG